MLLRSLSIRKGYNEIPSKAEVPVVEKRHHSSSRTEIVDNRGFWSNIFYVVPIIFSASLLLGTIFYRVHHGWQLSTAFYFSAQVLAGCMYDMPTETDPISTTFSLMFFLFGSSAMAAAFGAFVSTLVSNSSQIASEARKNIRSSSTYSIEKSQYEECALDMNWLLSQCATCLASFQARVGWYSHRSKYITILAALMWYSIGVTYGIMYEEFPLPLAFRFALGAMAASGVPPPVCMHVDGYYDCQLGTVRGIFVGIYVIVGVPLFAFTLGQFAGMIVESAIREREMQIMARPLGESEFKFALTLKRFPKKAPVLAVEALDEKEQIGEQSKPIQAIPDKILKTFNDSPPESLGTFLLNRSAATNSTENGNTVRFTSGRSNLMRPRAYSESCIVVPGPGISTQEPKALSEAESVQYPEFSIDFGEFVVLEMLRLRRVDEHDLGAIRNLFDDIDYDSAGQIDEAKLERFSKLMNSRNEAEMQESSKTAHTDSRKSYNSTDYKDCESPMSTSNHEIVLDSHIFSAMSPPISVTGHNGDAKDRPDSFRLQQTKVNESELEMKENVISSSCKESGASFHRNGNDNVSRSRRAFTAESESEALPLLSLSDLRANNSDNKIEVPDSFYGFPSNSNDSAVGGTSVHSDSSVSSQDSHVRAKRTLTHAYNQLLMPIIRLRQLRNNSASLTRPAATDDSREGTPTATIRKLSISMDMDTLGGDSDNDDTALKRAGSWWFRSQTPTEDDMDTSNREKKGRSEYKTISSPPAIFEKGASNHDDKGAGLGGRGGALGSPLSATHTHTDLEEGIRKVFGYSKYGAMNTIEEEIV